MFGALNASRMPSVQELLPRIRRICLALPETWEGSSLGHPTFHAGQRTFAVVEADDGRALVTFKAAPEMLADLESQARFRRAAHIGRHGWVSLALDVRVDWTEVQELLQASYRQVALKRMLEVLDGPVRRRAR